MEYAVLKAGTQRRAHARHSLSTAEKEQLDIPLHERVTEEGAERKRERKEGQGSMEKGRGRGFGGTRT